MLPSPQGHGESLAGIYNRGRAGTPWWQLLQDGSPDSAFAIEATLVKEVVAPASPASGDPQCATNAPLQGTPAFVSRWEYTIRVAFGNPPFLQHQETTDHAIGAPREHDNTFSCEAAERVKVRVLLAAHRLCKAARRFPSDQARNSGRDALESSLGSRDKQSVRVLLREIGDLIADDSIDRGREPGPCNAGGDSFAGNELLQQAHTAQDGRSRSNAGAESAMRPILWRELAFRLRLFAEYWFHGAFVGVVRSIYPTANEQARSKSPSYIVLWAVMSCAMDAIKWMCPAADAGSVCAETLPLLDAIKHTLAQVVPLLSPGPERMPTSSSCLIPAARKTVQVLLAVIQGAPELPLPFDDWESLGELLTQIPSWAISQPLGKVEDSSIGALFGCVRNRLDAERDFQTTSLQNSGASGSGSHKIADDPEWMARYLVASLVWLARGIEAEFDHKVCSDNLPVRRPPVWTWLSVILLHVDAADAIRVCAVNDAHLIAALAAHLRLWTAQRQSNVAGGGDFTIPADACASIMAMSPARLFGMVADDVFLGDASVAVDWALESPAFLAYVLRLARWLLLRAASPTGPEVSGALEDHRTSDARGDIQVTVESGPAGIDALRQLLRSAPVLPFPTRTLEATLARVLEILGHAGPAHRQREGEDGASDASEDGEFENRNVKRVRTR